MVYNWDFRVIFPYWDLFLHGVGITLLYSVVSIFFGVVLGILVCTARLSGMKIFNGIAIFYQEIFRCTPLLVQLLWFYYAFPLLVGGTINNKVAALLALSLYAGAFFGEIFRGAIISIDKGQHEASAAIGMSKLQSMVRIIMPQAVKRMLPAFINQSVLQLKNTSLVSVLSVPDLAYMAAVVNGETYRPLESYTIMAVLYLIMLLPLTQFAAWVERRMSVSD